MIDLLNLALPIMIVQILTILMVLTDLAFVGHLGLKELGAAALSTTLFNLLFLPLVGALTSIDTLFSQSFGAQKKKDVTKWLISSIVFSCFMTIPMSFLLLFAEDILVYGLHQDPILSSFSGPFCNYLIPGIFPLLIFIVLTKYLQTQKILKPSILIAVVANISNVICNWFLIYYLIMV